MLGLKKQMSTAELDRHLMAQLAPNMKRRASARSPQTEPVPIVQTRPRLSRTRVSLLLVLGFLLGLVLILLGRVLVNWIDDTSAHWHGGDGYVTTLDADVGHSGGESHFLAFYQNGYVTVVELASDYKSGHTYPIKVDGLGNSHHALTLTAQTIDGKRDLVIAIDTDTNFGIVLYNTGDAFSTKQP